MPHGRVGMADVGVIVAEEACGERPRRVMEARGHRIRRGNVVHLRRVLPDQRVDQSAKRRVGLGRVAVAGCGGESDRTAVFRVEIGEMLADVEQGRLRREERVARELQFTA